MWESNKPSKAVVEYGEKTPLTNKVEVADLKDLHEIKLKNLKPSTRYTYKVKAFTEAGEKLETPFCNFMTPVNPDEAFSFCIIGDTQRNPVVTGQIAKKMFDRRPNFAIHCGDVVDKGSDKNQWINDLFGPCADLFAHVPIYPTIGNHERNHENYYKYFSMPAPKYYYQFAYGNADFFVLDSNKSLKPGSEQYVWLEKALSESKAKWKFAYHHHPAWSSDADDYGKTWEGVYVWGDKNARNLVPLFEKYNLDIDFNGHIHLYERSWPIREGKVNRKNGVMYITSGGGGGSLEETANMPSWFKSQSRVDFHFCYATIFEGRLEFKVFDKNGNLFDSFELDKN
jgi:hypothetical protein